MSFELKHPKPALRAEAQEDKEDGDGDGRIR
jgi:hypothetical protein